MNTIEQTVQELNQRIDQLQEAKAALIAIAPLLESSTPLLPLKAPTPPLRVTKTMEMPPVKRKYTKRKVAADVSPRPSKHPLRQGKWVGKSESTKPEPPAVQGSVLANLDRPKTVGGAMKAVALTFTRPFTIADMRAEMEKQFPEIVAESSSSAINFNLSYWATKSGKLKQTGDGDNATYTIADRDWFAPKVD